MQEKSLHTWWQHLPHNQRLTAICGSNIIIHHPGNYNKYAGPDFRNAIITIDNTRFKGSIEIHVRTTDWFHHQHHLDKQYRDIILHIVWEHNSTDTQNIPCPIVELKNQPILLPDLPPQSISSMQLKEWAHNRFTEKVNMYKYQLQHTSFHQLIFNSFHKALGYPHNQYPFYLVADYVWKLFENQEKILFNHKPEIIFTFLLLNSVRNFPKTSGIYLTLNQFLPLLNTRYFIRLLKENPPPGLHFNFGGIYPVNHPTVKLQQLSHLYTMTPSTSLVENIIDCMFARRNPEQLVNNLYQCFMIRAGNKNKSSLLSKKRITEWLLTDLIPLFYSAFDSCNFRDYLSDLYFTLPAGYQYGKAQLPRLTYGWENQALLFHEQQFP